MEGGSLRKDLAKCDRFKFKPLAHHALCELERINGTHLSLSHLPRGNLIAEGLNLRGSNTAL